MKRNWIVLVGATALTLAATLTACKPQAPAEPPAAPAAPEAAAPAATTAPTAPVQADSVSAADQRAFAGTFAGILPCADCPGIDTKIALAGDGTYQIEETYQGKKDGHFNSDGTWTAEADGKHIRLDPNSKSEQDRLFELLSMDEIRLLDAEGKHIESALPYNLNRAAPTK